MRRNPHERHKTAGVDSRIYWDFQPGQHVMTREGFAGIVTAVDDGPYPGTESYRVTLDGNMGGGDYGASELRPLSGRSAAVDHTAADDYPELGSILEDRPPLELRRKASLQREGSFDPLDLDVLHQRYAGIMDWLNQPGNARDVALIGGGAYLMNRQRQNADRYTGDETGPYGAFHQISRDWCRFRKNQRCFFPKELDVQATRAKGFAVWTAVDRGYCPREDWTEQEGCPVSEPGPNSGRPDAKPAANVSNQVYEDRTAAKHASNSRIIAGNDLGFHMLAAWADVQTKARRIRSDGGVRIISSTEGSVVAQVEGDENVYQTTLVRVPGRQTVANWECGCAWSAYSWGRSGRWRKYEGRMCSHALALQYEAQSRGMYGKPVHEDRETPHWLDPTIPVKIPGDWDPNKGRYSSLDTPDVAPGIVLAAEMIADGNDPASVVATLEPLGAHEARWLVREALGFAHSFPAQYQGRNVLFTFDDKGQPVINGQPVDPKRLLYPSYDPSAGLHIASLQTEAYAGIPDHLTPGPLDKKLVDYKPDRKLSDPTKVVPITSILPESREVVYSKMPFLDHMHETGGMDPEGDTGAYMQARNKFFDAMPEADVPLDRLVVTQHNVNHERVKQMQEQPETRGSSLPQFVRHGGETWAINGHHRVVQEALDGSPTIRGRLWDLDGTVGHTALRTFAGADYAPVKDEHLGRCYEISGNRVAFGPDMSKPFGGHRGATLVHGTIQGFGLPSLEHAWVEEPDGRVYEPTTDHVYEDHDFDRLFNPTEAARYSVTETRRKMSQTQHYGPWHGEYAHLTPDHDGEEDDHAHEASVTASEETCRYCKKKAVKRVVHIYGGYIPCCEEHEDEAHEDADADDAPITPTADLHDRPEPALPTTDGGDDDHEDPTDGTQAMPAYDMDEGNTQDEDSDDKIASRQAGLAWIMNGTPQTAGDGPASRGAGGGGGSRISDSDIAAAARAHLAKTGAKKFSPAEQSRIINEGADVRAGNFGDLKLQGTHYEALDDMHALDEETLWP